MKIYLAARYTRRRELCAYADDLRAQGHQVTSTWIKGLHEASEGDDGHHLTGTPEQIRSWAEEDWADLHAADCLIGFTEPPYSEFSRGGRHVEWGAALAIGLRCICVGPRENVFYQLPAVERFDTWPEALAALAPVVTP